MGFSIAPPAMGLMTDSMATAMTAGTRARTSRLAGCRPRARGTLRDGRDAGPRSAGSRGRRCCRRRLRPAPWSARRPGRSRVRLPGRAAGGRAAVLLHEQGLGRLAEEILQAVSALLDAGERQAKLGRGV